MGAQRRHNAGKAKNTPRAGAGGIRKTSGASNPGKSASKSSKPKKQSIAKRAARSSFKGRGKKDRYANSDDGSSDDDAQYERELYDAEMESDAENAFETVPTSRPRGNVAKRRNEESDGNVHNSDVDSNLSDDSDSGTGSDDEELEKDMISRQLQAANRRKKKSGGFQSMGLSHSVYKAVLHKGYKVPTPIQRKAIPVIMEGRDVVAMARTGSGKTAAFLIPMMEKLKTHSAKVGARGLVLSPSRELALQTLKFVKDLSKYTDLRACVLVGGDSMEEQFAAIANNPDIIIATPGRLMHLIIEMNLDLRCVEYVVFDEADRLFEMGFAEQLKEITHKLPETRQTLLFSATLPKLLVDFAKAGLTEPVLIRLDVDTKIPSDLQMMFFSTLQNEKDAALLYTLKHLIPSKDMTIVFAATKHHVEYLAGLLEKAGIDNAYIYGSLDMLARKIALTKFRTGKTKVLIVTDVAARGIDVPLLDHVINYDFPAQSKVFVHRVGRAARAGRKGYAWSFVSTDEMPYLVDLQLFTGRPLTYGAKFAETGASAGQKPDYTLEIVLGTVPQPLLDNESEHVDLLVKGDASLEAAQRSAHNAYKLYHKTRSPAARESYKRAKEIAEEFLGLHPVLGDRVTDDDVKREEMIRALSGFRPPETIFEVNKKNQNDERALLMSKRRSDVGEAIEKKKKQQKERIDEAAKRRMPSEVENDVNVEKLALAPASVVDIEAAFGSSTGGKRKNAEASSPSITEPVAAKKVKKMKTSFRDEEYYIPHRQSDANTERGYAMPTASLKDAVSVDMQGDDAESMFKKRNAITWDSRKKKFVRPTIGSDNKQRIRTEAGQLVLASYKTERFAEWQQKSKLQLPRSGEQELDSRLIPQLEHNAALGTRRYRYYNTDSGADGGVGSGKGGKGGKGGRVGKSGKGAKTGKGGRARNELKSKAQIVRDRKIKEKRREKNARPSRKGKKY